MGLFDWLRGRRHENREQDTQTTQAGSDALLRAVLEHRDANEAAKRAARDERARDEQRRRDERRGKRG